MSDLSDAILLARYCSGDTLALEILLARYEAPLFQLLIGMLRNHHQAEDALQDTFIRALERLDGVDPDHLRGWLFTVAYHQAMLLKRKQKSRPAQPLEEGHKAIDGQPGPEAQAELQDEVGRLSHLLDRLPPAQREVIRQRVYEGKRFRDIAATLNCPLNTALARMHEGLKRLRLLWENEHA